MDMPRIPLRASFHDTSRNMEHDRHSSSSGASSDTSRESAHARAPMAIPNARHEDVPPPLPPPRYIDDLEHGIDVAWSWGNPESFAGGFSKLAPIKPSSSLFGSYRGTMNNRHPEHVDVHVQEDEAMVLDGDDDRKDSMSTICSPSQADVDTAGISFGGLHTTAAPTPPSPTTASNQRLHGEKPLAQQNLHQSSHAYDKHVLSKIGKSSSPPRHGRSNSQDSPMPLAQQRSIHASDAVLLQLAVADTLANSLDPISRWVTSPISAGVSPGSRSTWRDFNLDYRTSSVDESTPSSAVEPDVFARLRESHRPATSGSLPGLDDALSVASRSNRDSYDLGTFTEPDADSPIEETGVLRKLNLGDNGPSPAERRRSLTKLGMKRRAPSPTSDQARDDKLTVKSNIGAAKSNVGGLARSPNLRHPKFGSVSSTASSVRQNSLASSVALSAAGSSMTSISSFERHSPNGISLALSPAVETSSESPYVTSATSVPFKSGAAVTSTPRKPPPTTNRNSHDGRTANHPHKMSAQPATTDRSSANANANRIAGHFICECCPKKPKKFDTEAELSIHEMEKQYTCQYCHNRFKNKNEAERHQNSLHLRRHSWSCAAISSLHAAFHPSTSTAAQTPNGPAADACGFCGEDFPNHPQADWERRADHLTNVHKFRECNQAKKFYRADHFRQHLKHSHAGLSGKWTNMLESACMKDEPPLDTAKPLTTAADESNSLTASSLGRSVDPGSEGLEPAQDE